MEDLNSVLQYAKSKNYPVHNPRGLYVEYLQHEILCSIFKHTTKLSFIGGTALRMIFHTQRFSEDLDFDNFGLSIDEFEILTKEVQKDLEAIGFNVEFRNVFKGAYHCYFRFSDMLFRYGFSPHENEKILVRLDTVRQDFNFVPETAVMENFGIFFEVKHNPKDILLSQKFIASLERSRSKGRDFYDITYLMSITKPNLEYLKQKIGIASLPELKERLLARCAEVNFEEMARDVAPFLFNTGDTIRITKFKQYIEQWEI
ncbi:MAG: nucleotidyl transferase AbiEii/AbiGii toxin family protein [Patescibacteria group bacterium]